MAPRLANFLGVPMTMSRMGTGSLSFILFIFIHSPAYGRFMHQDAQNIDDDREMTGLNLHDEIAYDYYWDLEKSWYQPGEIDVFYTGYRTKLGSYDPDRFFYQESLRLSSRQFHSDQQKTSAYFWLSQETLQSRNDMVRQRQIALGIPINESAELHILTDPQQDKSKIDLGLGLRLRHAKRWDFFVSLWLVDPHFNAKNIDQPGTYLNQPYAISSWFNGYFDRRWIILNGHYESPLLWQKSESLDYRYQRTMFFAEWREMLNSQNWLLLQSSINHKQEQLWGNDSSGAFGHSLDRGDQRYRLGYVYDQGDRQQDWSLITIARNADHFYGQQIESADPVEISDPNDALNPMNFAIDDRSQQRWEVAGVYRYSYQGSEGRRNVWGLFANYGRIQTAEESHPNVQAKLQYAVLWQFTPHSQLAMHVAWDIGRTYRYVSGEMDVLLPWGGGGAQIQYLF